MFVTFVRCSCSVFEVNNIFYIHFFLLSNSTEFYNAKHATYRHGRALKKSVPIFQPVLIQFRRIFSLLNQWQETLLFFSFFLFRKAETIKILRRVPSIVNIIQIEYDMLTLGCIGSPRLIYAFRIVARVSHNKIENNSNG